MCMNNNRLPKIIFNWDFSWSSNIKSIVDDIDCQNEFISKSQVSMNSCWALLHELQCKQWLDGITRKTKLCTYVIFKNSYEVEHYHLLIEDTDHILHIIIVKYF